MVTKIELFHRFLREGVSASEQTTVYLHCGTKKGKATKILQTMVAKWSFISFCCTMLRIYSIKMNETILCIYIYVSTIAQNPEYSNTYRRGNEIPEDLFFSEISIAEFLSFPHGDTRPLSCLGWPLIIAGNATHKSLGY